MNMLLAEATGKIRGYEYIMDVDIDSAFWADCGHMQHLTVPQRGPLAEDLRWEWNGQMIAWVLGHRPGSLWVVSCKPRQCGAFSSASLTVLPKFGRASRPCVSGNNLHLGNMRSF
jgi:hypothetical protein